jgi:hypothetical protein
MRNILRHLDVQLKELKGSLKTGQSLVRAFAQGSSCFLLVGKRNLDDTVMVKDRVVAQKVKDFQAEF